MPSHPKPAPKAKKPGAMRTKPKAAKTQPAAKVMKGVDLTDPDNPEFTKADLAKSKGPEFLTPAERKAFPKTKVAGDGSKTDIILAMLKKGATSKEMEAATGWKPHSVRGLLGTLRSKGVKVISTKEPKHPTVYSIASTEPVGDVV